MTCSHWCLVLSAVIMEQGNKQGKRSRPVEDKPKLCRAVIMEQDNK
ncbi:MAG: hypothetical protein RIE73_19050 [Coleofasciculus sp. C1-SOL-03]